SNHPPSLIIHGDKDRIVPFAYGEIYFQDLKKAGVNTEMLVMKEGGHQWPLQFHDIIVRWLNSQNKSESTNMESKDKFNLDATFDGQKITLQRGETFSLGLKGVPTAGYLWKIVEIDDKTLKILEEGQKILTKPKLVGGSSLFFWRFQSLQKGETRLVLKHFRPWEGADNAHKTFSLIIEIK
ncbi:protease inhibitor I42 family protein, partial [Candidatus Sumerlaeota bacterium]|nr:protease inhibitor I42 family protein [Candidatus Sumerlaeota bacterium]